MLATDPEREHIGDAFVRDHHVLGLIMDPNLTGGQAQTALKSPMKGMQRTVLNHRREVIRLLPERR